MERKMVDLNENCFLDALFESVKERPEWGEDDKHFVHRVFDEYPDVEEWFKTEWKLYRKGSEFFREIEDEDK